MLPPGIGRSRYAIPVKIAPVASVAMIGWILPATTTTPLKNPQAAPASSVTAMPPTICAVEPLTRCEATQLLSASTDPTERSSPPVSTGSVCAIAANASARP